MNTISPKHPLCELDYLSPVRQRLPTIPKELEMRALVRACSLVSRNAIYTKHLRVTVQQLVTDRCAG